MIAIIKKQIESQDHVLLRFNPYWLQYFFVGGRFETKYHTFENTLREEMDEKLHLKPEAYEADFVDRAKMIQYSDRDQKLKHYIFHLYSIQLAANPWPDASPFERERGLVWVNQEHIKALTAPNGEPISHSVREIARSVKLFDDRDRFPLSL